MNNLIYVYSLRFQLLAKFHAANGYGIDQIGAGMIVSPSSLPSDVVIPSAFRGNKVIVKRMD